MRRTCFSIQRWTVRFPPINRSRVIARSMARTDRQSGHLWTEAQAPASCLGLRAEGWALGGSNLGFGDELANKYGQHRHDLSRRQMSTAAGGKPVAAPAAEQDLPVAAAESEAPLSPLTPEEPKHFFLKMPEVTSEDKFGSVSKWFKQVGDPVKPGDIVCEIELEQFSINMSVEDAGFVAQLLVGSGKAQIPVGSHIAVVVEKEEDVAKFAPPTPESEAKAGAAANESPTAEPKGTAATKGAAAAAPAAVTAAGDLFSFSPKQVMHVIHRLQKEGKLDEEACAVLLSLARKKDEELMLAFDGSFEEDVYDEAALDVDFFIAQAKSIASERARASKGDEEDSDDNERKKG